MSLFSFVAKLPRLNYIIFAVGAIGILIGAIGVHETASPSAVKFFDNLHWTSGTVAAALLAGLGIFRTGLESSRKSQRWFFLGFMGYAVGQIIWDIQTAVGFSAFPSPSDLFYLWLGPFLCVALFYEMQVKDGQYNQLAYWLDLLALAVAALTLVLISYLPRQGELDVLSMTVLVAYPTTLLIPVLMLLLMIPTMRLLLDAKLFLFLIASSVTAWSWMHWNSMALDGTTIDGSWFNVSFSISILISGLVVSDWRLRFSDNTNYDRSSEAFLRFLPIITVILSSAAIILISSNPLANKLVENLVYIGAAIVIVLAIIRQSRLLQERDTLLQVQQEALRSAAIIKTIIQTVPVRIFWKDRNLNYLGSNDLFARDAGFECHEQLVGKNDFDMGWKDQAKLYRSDDLRIMESGKAVVGYEEPQTTPSGNQIWLRTSKAPLIDDVSGETIGILGIYDDITARRQAEERLQYALEGVGDGLWDWNIKTGDMFFSKRFKEMLGYDESDEWDNVKEWTDRVHPDDIGWVHNELQEYFVGRKPTHAIELRMQCKEGSYKWILSKGVVVGKDVNGEPTRMIGSHSDVSQMKAIQLKLKELNENLEQQVEIETSKRLEKERLLVQQSRLATMGEMISNIAHQWRQPLNALALKIQDIPLAVQCGDMNKEYADNVNRESMQLIKYMSQTIEDFRNFFKPDKQKVEFDIKESIEHALVLIKDSLKSSCIDIEVDASDDDMKFFGYPNEFSQALLNVISNARDALKEHKDDSSRQIKIIAKKINNTIVVSILDNAGGIPQDIIDKIFDPYFTTKHSSQGTGLGLYMSKMIIEQNMGGKLNVHNAKEGACFNIELYIPNQVVAAN